ncbi:response regulator [Corallococcus macrosporus]|uniref:response regulator n=1 Tax=Corallococcus macrosporus TaxID=35 RepID=UPI0003163DC9|nr:response regulator [Corallococcus macrosporus]
MKNDPLRILVAEDSPTARRLLVEILRADPGLTVVGEAKDGVEAVELAQRLRPSLVTMDIQMPRMDGLEATRRIREELPPKVQPWVIAMTANAMDSDREQCFAAGMDDFLGKPIRVEALTAALLRCQ